MGDEKTQDTANQTFEEIANEATADLDSSENNENLSEENFEEEFEIKEEPIDYSLKAELQRLFKRPLYIAAFVLGILLIMLFLLMTLQLREEQDFESIVGYVKIHHKLPANFKGKPPKEVTELLEIYKQKRQKIKEDLTLIKSDPRENRPVIAPDDQLAISNKDLIPVLEKQKIGKVDLGGAEVTEKMNLSGYNLTKLNFVYFYKFVGSDLRYCDFTGIEAEKLEFRGASLQYAQFVDAIVPNSDFTRARLSYTNFYNSSFDQSLFIGAIAEQAHFSNSRLVSTNFASSILFNSDFEEVVADGLIAYDAHFEGVSFRDSSLVGANFRNSSLQGVNFTNCNLKGANFENADLEGSNFEGADLEGVNFKNANVIGVNFNNVKNATYDQLNQSNFLPNAYKIPDELVPKKYNFETRINPPRRT